LDLLLVKTCQDVLADQGGSAGHRGPPSALLANDGLMVSSTQNGNNRHHAGGFQIIAAVWQILEPFPIEHLGLNCATGPEQMKEHVRAT